MKKYPYTNLVFRGGGILGIAYLGAIKVLDSDEYDILKNITRVSGASAGAITALVTSISNNADDIIRIANSLDFSKVPDKREEKNKSKIGKEIEKLLGGIGDDLTCVKRLYKEYGWFTTDYFYNWLKGTIDAEFQKNNSVSSKTKNLKGLQTFSDFKDAGFRDIYVSVTNISKHRNEIFSFENKPDMPVADAVRMSMSIPLYFEAVKYNGDYYADGGTVNNYPLEIFDNKKFVAEKNNFIDGINLETLGCHLFTPENGKKNKNKKDNLIHYIEDLFLTLLQVQTIEYNKTPNLQKRSANISDLGISAVDFNIKPDNKDPFRKPLPDTPYDNLYRSGYNGMKEYLKKLNG